MHACTQSRRFHEREDKVVKITGPWKSAIMYALNRSSNPHYDALFEAQFFDLQQHERLPMADFVDVLCDNFTRYQRSVDGAYQIVPTDKQKAFLQKIITAEECFHFSEVTRARARERPTCRRGSPPAALASATRSVHSSHWLPPHAAPLYMHAASVRPHRSARARRR